jgi:hypothetical protein
VVESVHSAVRTDCLYKADFYSKWSVYTALRAESLYKADLYPRWNVFRARYEMRPYITHMRLVLKELVCRSLLWFLPETARE